MRPFGEADYEAVCAVATTLQPDTPWSAERWLGADRTRAPHLKTGGLLAELEGRTVGFVRYTQYADYFQPDKVVSFGGVLPEFRRQGFGDLLLAGLERQLLTVGVTQLQAEVSEADPATLTFLNRSGFRETWRRFEYRLDVRRAASSALEPLESRLAGEGVRVMTYQNLAADPDLDEKLRMLNWKLENDVPYGEAPQKLSPAEFSRERLEPEQVLKDALFIALNGETFVGMSSLWRYGTRLETDFTGVLPAYRGRGVAALMKLKGVRYAQENGFAELRTANDAVNGPMRRLNESLGFVAQPALLRLEKQLG